VIVESAPAWRQYYQVRTNSRERNIGMASRASTRCAGCIGENAYCLRVAGPETSALFPPM
jgi:hypothetical protein